ncbi:hypothetical protein [Methylobacterium sp. P1-11]|uniref:hypothetical protein n=1 Tax=Methylobacterium sp. P1-11 TaxID=2024616 RepID=UPI0011EFA266|nr:hypothetical protein [Methylobacterium sp. P1-11]
MSSKKTPAPKTPSCIEGLRKTDRRADDLDHLDQAFAAPGVCHGRQKLPRADLARALTVPSVLAASMLYEALTPVLRRPIERGQHLATVVSVAIADWIDPVEVALRRAHRWKYVFSCLPRLSPHICSGWEKRIFERAPIMPATVLTLEGRGQLHAARHENVAAAGLGAGCNRDGGQYAARSPAPGFSVNRDRKS